MNRESLFYSTFAPKIYDMTTNKNALVRFPESRDCISGSDYGSVSDSGAWGGNCAFGYVYGWTSCHTSIS